MGGDVYYTLDGSKPTTNSFKYESPFTITQNSLVKAIAICTGSIDSTVSSQYCKMRWIVNLSANGGSWSYGQTSRVESILDGECLFDEGHRSIDLPTRDEYTLAGWLNGDEDFSITSPVTSNLNLVAKWVSADMTIPPTIKWRNETYNSADNDQIIIGEDPSIEGATITITGLGEKQSGLAPYYLYDAINFNGKSITVTAKKGGLRKSDPVSFPITFYTVTFDANLNNGDTPGYMINNIYAPSAISVHAGAKIPLFYHYGNNTVKKDAKGVLYKFSSWSTTKGGSSASDIPITKDTTLYASWVPCDAGEAPVISINDNKVVISHPYGAKAIKWGYSANSIDNNYTTPFNPWRGGTIHAKVIYQDSWNKNPGTSALDICAVSFSLESGTKTQSGATSLAPRVAVKGGKASAPTETVVKVDKDDKQYDFVAWTTASGEVFDFDSVINENITLYPKWAEWEEVGEPPTVSIDSDNKVVLTAPGSSAIKYKLGTANETLYNGPFNANTNNTDPAANILTAKAIYPDAEKKNPGVVTKNICVVDFNLNGGEIKKGITTTPSTLQKVVIGGEEKVTPPDSSLITRKDRDDSRYDFVSWNTTSGSAFDFNRVINGRTEIVATWDKWVAGDAPTATINSDNKLVLVAPDASSIKYKLGNGSEVEYTSPISINSASTLTARAFYPESTKKNPGVATKNLYIVTFNLNGGTTQSGESKIAYKFAIGGESKITAPTGPFTKVDSSGLKYEFVSWTTSTGDFDFNSPINSNTALSAA